MGQCCYHSGMKLPLVGTDHPTLRRPADPVKQTTSPKGLANNLIETMVAEGGVGLAAPQVGQSLRVFVTGVERDYQTYTNPTLVWSSDEEIWWEEGCLSLPRLLGQVKRPKRVTIKALDAQGRQRTMEADNLLARVLQHELDHLQGVLFPDRMADLSSLRTLSEEEWQSRFQTQTKESNTI